MATSSGGNEFLLPTPCWGRGKGASPSVAWWGGGTQKSCPDSSLSGWWSCLHVVFSLFTLTLTSVMSGVTLGWLKRHPFTEKIRSKSSFPCKSQGLRREGTEL